MDTRTTRRADLSRWWLSRCSDVVRSQRHDNFSASNSPIPPRDALPCGWAARDLFIANTKGLRFVPFVFARPNPSRQNLQSSREARPLRLTKNPREKKNQERRPWATRTFFLCVSAHLLHRSGRCNAQRENCGECGGLGSLSRPCKLSQTPTEEVPHGNHGRSCCWGDRHLSASLCHGEQRVNRARTFVSAEPLLATSDENSLRSEVMALIVYII